MACRVKKWFTYVQATLSCEAVANHAASTKKAKYGFTAVELQASFIPSTCMTFCMFFTKTAVHCEYAAFQKWLSYCIASKWQELFFVIMACVSTHKLPLFVMRPLSFVLLIDGFCGHGLHYGQPLGLATDHFSHIILYLYTRVISSYCVKLLHVCVLVIFLKEKKL